ncbi:MAG: redoxin family protein [Flavobacteriaceae bacterium]|nr:MAG: redoxin family protein [Flavobacteriaceae bacterium]
MRKITLVLMIILSGCISEQPVEFSPEALAEKFMTIEGKEVTAQDILDTCKGKKMLIDIWASWCADCISGLPELKKLQRENPDVAYVFLSLDKKKESWKKGIKKYQIEGAHYFMPNGNKGAFEDFLNISWIPRYVVLDETGKIALFKATKITDKKIIEALKN